MHVLGWLDECYPTVGPSAVAFVKVSFIYADNVRPRFSCTFLCPSCSPKCFWSCISSRRVYAITRSVCLTLSQAGEKQWKRSRALCSFFACFLTIFTACIFRVPRTTRRSVAALTRSSGGESGEPARFAVVASELPWRGRGRLHVGLPRAIGDSPVRTHHWHQEASLTNFRVCSACVD